MVARSNKQTIANREGGLSVRQGIDGNFEETYKYIENTGSAKRKALFTIRFDDGNSDHYSKWFPFLTSKGCVGVDCLVTDWMGSGGYMTWAQALEMEAAGWEMVSHGKTHDSWNDMTEAEIITQCSESLAAMEAAGLTVNNIVPPGYSGQSLVGRRVSRDYFRSAGTGYTIGLIDGANPKVLNYYNLCSARGDISGDFMLDSPSGIARIKEEIDLAETEGRWFMLFMHSWTTALQSGLDEIIDYVQAKSIDIVTINEGLDTYPSYLRLGRMFEVGEDGVRIDAAYGDIIWADTEATCLGFQAGKNAKKTTDSHNVYIGDDAGNANTGILNVGIGYNAGKDGAGSGSVNIGAEAGDNNDEAGVSLIGYRAGKDNQGQLLHAFGAVAGQENTAHNCLFLGRGMGYQNADNSQIEIGHNSASPTPFIRGNMATGQLTQGAPNSAPSDTAIDNSRLGFYLDEITNKLMVKVKYSDGTVKTGEVANLI